MESPLYQRLDIDTSKMRLLEIKGSGEVTLAQDFLTNLPPYAVLSHTWGDEEVIFRDFAEGCEKCKKGYRKIQFCGDQAARDGLKYFGVDTCCIDKSNSVELTEAINSMFRWYRNSAKCYVYLPDVSVTSSSTAEQWGVAFQRSRWFTRGWTLQELIAPSSVEFFSERGEWLGDRNSMDRRISEITGINVEALRGKPLA